MTALESGAHEDALALVDELVALGARRRWTRRVGRSAPAVDSRPHSLAGR
jgi:hypothetical protein